MLVAMGVLLFSGVAALVSPRRGARIGVAGAVAGSLCALAAAAYGLCTGSLASLHLPWNLPGAAFHIRMDALSALFVIPIGMLGALCALYGVGYLKGHEDTRGAGVSWFHYNLLVASMLLVVVADNAILFLLAWETMALTSFFLVAFDNVRGRVRMAGWIYMVATHLGTAFLLALFAILGETAGSYEFDAFRQAGAHLAPSMSALCFFFALIGFGVKAGFIPLHVWLPEAHPAAPSHVSALMSGVMIKTGIYGLLRLLGCLGTPAPWWGWCLLMAGILSGILGVLFALAQHDIKRLLAFCSVENIGIITIGLGLGYVGLTHGAPALACLGFAGGLLHVVNHAVFKGLLFLAAGSVLHATGTGDIDHLGGLLKRMRLTGAVFLVGAVAISGLPPFNGFVSEFLIYLGAFNGVTTAPAPIVTACLLAIASLALMGGLAAACFTKVFGMTFLGEPRSGHAAHGHDPLAAMRLPMLVLAAGCALIGFAAPAIASALAPAVAVITKAQPDDATAAIGMASSPLSWIVACSAGLVTLTAALYALRNRMLARRVAGTAGTWDCGYAAPTARMQYTASSFAQPLTDFFSPILRTRHGYTPPDGILPSGGSFATETRDMFRNEFYEPVFERVAALLACLRGAQHGRIQLYVLYIALTLMALLVFGLGWNA